MRRFVIGDIHGAYKALMQCFEKCEFNYETDKLIFLGDMVDGWSQSKEVVEELMKVKNLVKIIGNHDEMMLTCMGKIYGYSDEQLWAMNGGQSTIDSFGGRLPSRESEIYKFIASGVYYHEEDGMLFVHGGIPIFYLKFKSELKLEDIPGPDYTWDRSMINSLYRSYVNLTGPEFTIPFEEIYIGHTPIFLDKPEKIFNVWCMDQGAGWNGHLSIMNIDTKEYWLSDKVSTLYPNEKGRM